MRPDPRRVGAGVWAQENPQAGKPGGVFAELEAGADDLGALAGGVLDQEHKPGILQLVEICLFGSFERVEESAAGAVGFYLICCHGENLLVT